MTGKTTAKSGRKKKLAAALRANLKRRKETASKEPPARDTTK